MKRGECLGLLGLNGAGKSTLLKILADIEVPDDIYVSKHSMLKRGSIAYVPQTHFIPRKFKVEKAMKLMIPEHHLHNVIKDNIIAVFRHNRMIDLSIGVRRYVESLFTLYSRSIVILLDEPFSKLDPIQRTELGSHIEQVKRTKSIVVTDHAYELVNQLSDRLLYLNNGVLEETNLNALNLRGYLRR